MWVCVRTTSCKGGERGFVRKVKKKRGGTKKKSKKVLFLSCNFVELPYFHRTVCVTFSIKKLLLKKKGHTMKGI